MNLRTQSVSLTAILVLATLPAVADAFPDCPADHVIDGYTCAEQTGAGKTGGFFRVTFPSDWDGDLVIVNHGFDLNDKHIRPHETCSHTSDVTCEEDSDCGANKFCNNISYLGLDEVLLPMGKAVAASTYTDSGWATFHSAKDIKDIIKHVKKSDFGDQLQRVIITGFSGGGAVTADATLKLKIDGAVPLCAAAAGGLTLWDVAHEVRLVYDYVCEGVAGATFVWPSDQGEPNTTNSDSDAISMALKVDTCFGILGVQPDDGHQAERLAKFLALTQFTGDASHGGSGINVASAVGLAVLGMGDFVHDPKRLKGKRIGFNDTLDYTTLGSDPMLAADYDDNVERLTAGKGRKQLRKAFWPDFTKGRGKKVSYPILSMAGANDWLVIPEFNRVYADALAAGNKAFTQTWIETYGHCVFSEQEMTALFTEYFEWLGPVGGPYGVQPTATDISNTCLALPGGVAGDTCNFDLAFAPGAIYDRVPQREDWPAASKAP
jgi:pimeloyl-ACP methyl ester carboxylesterase